MATIRWYLVNGVDANGWQALSTTVQTAATCNAGWIVGTGATNSSELAANAERASATFTGNTVPDGTLDTTLKDAFRSPTALNGSFASANWVFQFAVRSPTSGGAADGQVVFRLIKANADGSSPTLITAAQQSATVLTNVANTTDANSTLTVNPGAFTITNQYVFVQVAWKRTGAGGNVATNIRLRTGSAATPTGSSLLTADFTDLTQSVTGVHRATTRVLTAGAVALASPNQPVTAPSVNSHIQVEYYNQAQYAATFAAAAAWSDALRYDFPLNTFGQSFHASARFSGLQISLGTQFDADGTLVMELHAGGPMGTVLATATRPQADTLDDGVGGPFRLYRFDFPTVDPGGSSTLYTWLIQLTGATASADHTYVAIGTGGVPMAPAGNSSWAFYEGDLEFTEYAYTYFTRVLSESVFAGTVALDGGAGDQAVTGTTLASGGAVVRTGTVTTLTAVSGATLSSTATLTAGSVTTTTAVTGATRTSGAQVFAGTVTTTPSVIGASRASTLALFPGAVSTSAAGAVSGARVASTAVVFPGVVSGVAVPVLADQPFMWLM